MSDADSSRFMQIALNISKRGIGTVSPNPSVGCVIADKGVVLSRGWTQPGGRPHAEFVAINNNRTPVSESTAMYVTLEPCCHLGDKPSCASIIINSGIKNIFIATVDRDERTSGNGIKLLQQSGINVHLGTLEEDARKINCGFFCSKILKRPFITIKVAVTIDGKAGALTKHSKWITNEFTRHWSHKLRAENDAILVSNRTFLKDNPLLSCRLPGLEKYSPKKFILDNHALITTKLDDNTWLITGENIQKKNVIQIQRVSNGHLNLHQLVTILAEMGITRLLVECTDSLFAAFLTEDLVDQIVVCRANKIAGNDAIPMVGNLHISDVNSFLQFRIQKTFNICSETVEIWERLQTLFL